MHMKYTLKTTIICLCLLWSNSTLSFTVSGRVGRTSGHEEITRQAIVHAAEILKDEFNISLEMATETELSQLIVKFTGLKISGGTIDNPVIMVNFATDKTDFNNGENWPDDIDISKFYNFPPKSGSTSTDHERSQSASMFKARSSFAKGSNNEVLHSFTTVPQ